MRKTLPSKTRSVTKYVNPVLICTICLLYLVLFGLIGYGLLAPRAPFPVHQHYDPIDLRVE